ncbi:MAG: outer membrane beta-barrel protein [Spirochaetota bacterium]
MKSPVIHNRRLFAAWASALALAALLHAPAAMAAEEPASPAPRVSFGAGALAGTYDVANAGDGPGAIESSFALGGGLVFESMMSRHFGIHSGLWYSMIDFKYEEEGSAKIQGLSIPFMLLASTDWRRLSFGLLAGFNLTHYLTASMNFGGSDVDVLKYINDTQFGLAGGFEIKFAVGRFTDIFVSLIGERNLSTFSDDKGSSDHMYGAAIRSGVLFRTF